jgi:hypothetical protein
MKKNVSLGDFLGLCKLIDGLKGNHMSEEIIEYGMAFVAKVQVMGQMENTASVVK